MMRIDFTIPSEKITYVKYLYDLCHFKKPWEKPSGRNIRIGQMLYDGLLQKVFNKDFKNNEKDKQISTLWRHNQGQQVKIDKLKAEIEKYKSVFGELPENIEKQPGIIEKTIKKIGIAIAIVLVILLCSIFAFARLRHHSNDFSMPETGDSIRVDISIKTDLQRRIKREINRNNDTIAKYK